MIGVISDVHGNLPALQAVLHELDRRSITRVWCLGDTLGYGPYPNECLELVDARCELVLAGNHDLAVRGDLSLELFGGTAGAGVHYARHVLTPENRARLSHLAPSRFLEGVELYHASAGDPVWEYVRTADVATAHLRLQRLPLSMVGHSHLQLSFALPQGASRAVGGRVAAGDSVPLDGTRRLVNPGSVGQPRDRDPRAAFAVVHHDRVEFDRVAYDVAAMRAAVANAGLPAEIGERLELGW